MSNNHIPIRRCIGCGRRAPKSGLIKIVKTREDNGDIKVFVCLEYSDGRGAYLCKDYECFKKAKKSRRLERAFSRKIDEDIYDQLEGMVRGFEQ